MLPAEIIEIVEYLDRLLKIQGLAVAAIITVTTVQVTELGDVPLQGKGRSHKTIRISENTPGKIFCSNEF